jgi:hypothetical protein
MMRAQFTFTPTESKKLIAKAVAHMDLVKRAAWNGIIVAHPSSSTYFIIEELTGKKPDTPVWVCGVIVPKGACLSRGASKMDINARTSEPHIEDYSGSWVIEKGKYATGVTLGQLFGKMGPGDVYLKGVNAIDASGTVGILIGNRKEGGSFGSVLAASKRKGFEILFPVGLEKLIPGKIEDAAREAIKTKYDYAMGINCALLPCKNGTVVTECDAIRILSGAIATPIAAGGLDGAEGAITIVVKGESEQVTKAIEYAEQSKGARLPRADAPGCRDCGSAICDFPLEVRPWAKDNTSREGEIT